MSCEIAIDRLLEAAPAEIAEALTADRGTGTQPPDELGTHLSGCAACRTLATSVLEQHRALAGALMETTPPTTLDDALAQAEAEATSRRSRRARRWWTAAVPATAAAAAATALLLGRGLPVGAPTPEARTDRVAAWPADVPAVLAAEHDNVAVLQTGNPDIVVFWFF